MTTPFPGLPTPAASPAPAPAVEKAGAVPAIVAPSPIVSVAPVVAPRAPRRGFFVLFGPQGGGKSFAALKTFQRALYISSDVNNPQFYKAWLEGEGKNSGRILPLQEMLISDYHTAGVPPDFPHRGTILNQVGLPTRVPMKMCLEYCSLKIAQAVWGRYQARQPQAYNWVIVDEMGEFFERVFAEISPAFLTSNGKVDIRTAYAALAKWAREWSGPLRSIVNAGVGLVFVSHDQDPDLTLGKKGGARLGSRQVSEFFTGVCDGALHRIIEDEAVAAGTSSAALAAFMGTPAPASTAHATNPEIAAFAGAVAGDGVLAAAEAEMDRTALAAVAAAQHVNPKSRRKWRVHVSQNWRSKLRGLSDAFFDQIQDKDLDQIIPMSGFDL